VIFFPLEASLVHRPSRLTSSIPTRERSSSKTMLPTSSPPRRQQAPSSSSSWQQRASQWRNLSMEQLDFECVWEGERASKVSSFFFNFDHHPFQSQPRPEKNNNLSRYALWFLLQLVTSPKTAHRHVSYHRQSKGRWSRDDPSFTLLVAALCLGGALSHAAALAHGLGSAVRGTLLAVVVGFLGSGVVMAAVGWSLANAGPGVRGGGGGSEGTTTTTTAGVSSSSSPDASSFSSSEPVELAYCFDVHANAFSAVALLLYCGQVVLLPFLLLTSKGGAAPPFVFLSSLLSNALFAASAASYWYLTFLGFAALPAVGPQRAQVALWPGIVGVGLAPVFALAGVNPSRLVLGFLFG